MDIVSYKWFPILGSMALPYFCCALTLFSLCVIILVRVNVSHSSSQSFTVSLVYVCMLCPVLRELGTSYCTY